MKFCPFTQKECSSECAIFTKDNCALVVIAKGVNLTAEYPFNSDKSLGDAVESVAHILSQSILS